MKKIKFFIKILLDAFTSSLFLCFFSFVLACLSAASSVPCLNLVLSGSPSTDPTDLIDLLWTGFFSFSFLVGLFCSISDVVTYFKNRKSSGKEPDKNKNENKE